MAELGAVDEDNELTPVGRTLAKLPLDPRVGRMILEAKDRQALDEVLVPLNLSVATLKAQGRYREDVF